MKKYMLILLSALAMVDAGICFAKSEMFKYSTTVEKERPELNEETKRLIAEYRKNPTAENYNALRKQAEINYDKVVARKKAKLEELKKTVKHFSKVEEMQEIVDEMLKDRENRLRHTMLRFTDTRLRPNSRKASDGYLPVLGAAQNVYVAYAPVTNKEYSAFLEANGGSALKFLPQEEDYPVVNVSYNDALKYCKWLSEKDKNATYRLPTEEEWELAAGHMPKDADMNCGEDEGLKSVEAYKQTLAASGAIDMWGNVWEWTSTPRTEQYNLAVKGGAWNTKRTECRTENRKEERNLSKGYNNVGFRIIKEKQI